MDDAERERLNDKLNDLQDRIRELEITLHGKRAKTGLLSEYARHDELLARLYAVIWQDPTGQKGILHDIDVLMGRARNRNEHSTVRWQSWTAIIVAIIMSAASLLTNLDKIIAILPKYHPGPLERKIDLARHPKGKKIYRYHVIPAKAASETPTDTTENEK